MNYATTHFCGNFIPPAMKKFAKNFIRNRSSYDSLFLADRHQQILNGSSSLKIQVVKMSESGSKPGAAASSEGNLLTSEKSPYLLQHKNNPVHWHPWGEDAFAVAKLEKKPIFLSVGYSTCHWCHVMERESFENEDVAKVMNEHFVNVKMDREEHPDIDRIYMTFVQAVSGSGGWPMSVWMTPELKPFYGGTYYPPNDSWGRPGFKSLLQTIAEQWDDNSEKFYTSAEKILEMLERSATLPVSETLPEAGVIAQKCFGQLSHSYEPAFGGFSNQPKFPQPVNINFMIYFKKANPDNSMSLQIAERTLKGIAKGGIHDHVGKGFCRYSTDRKWHVPHFEKMLYDNAQLAVAYTNMYLLTGDSYYADIVHDIFEYIQRDMRHNEGGFYSAEDADSYPEKGATHKAEGAFYAYTAGEIEEVFGGQKINDINKHDVFNWRYGVREAGNVDPRGDPHGELKGKNVLYFAHTYEETAKKFGITSEDAKNICKEGEQLLFEFRNANRPRPGLDTKFIASWNGLMISAFARAGAALDRQDYIEQAEKAMAFVGKYLRSPDGDIYRTCYREGEDNSSPVVNFENPILGCVDDFANLVAASLELFDATSKLEHLERAIQLQKKQDEIFWDPESGGYFNGRESSSVIVRFKDDDDGAEPSSNSVSSVNLIRLYSITGNSDYGDKVVKLFHQFGDRLGKLPITLPMMTTASVSYSAGTKLLLVLTKNDEISENYQTLRHRLLPLGSTIIRLNVEKCDNLERWKSLIPFLTEKIEDFKLRADSAPENIYLRQGQRYTHSCDKDEFENILSAL